VPSPSLRGRLLVATPLLSDGIFDRSVVLLLEHGDEGALGVVLNRPSEIQVEDALPDWSGAAIEPAVMFVGGPVGLGGALCLGRATEASLPSWEPVVDGVGIVDLHVPADLLEGRVHAIRMFSGHAGWAPGQLEDELEARAWLVVDARPGDVLSQRPEELWRRVLRRQPGTAARLANHPHDPSLN
jgi:putative transcriptional regulator